MTLFEVRARPPQWRGDRLTAPYEVADAAAALAAFAAERPEICTYNVGRDGWHLVVVIPGAGEPPERWLKNWERNPDAEASDGWLSNIAACANTLKDRLEWEPEFCAAARWFTPCPACSGGLVERYGKHGAFFACDGCGLRTGVATKKGVAAERAATITGWCGTRLEVRYGHLGNPYAGCCTCHPKYRHPTVNEVYYGGRRR